MLETGQSQRNSVSNDLEANKGNLRKTWNLINELTLHNSGKTSNNLEIKADDKTVRNPVDIVKSFNIHFTNIAQVLAEDIPAVELNPEFYLKAALISRLLCKFRVLMLN